MNFHTLWLALMFALFLGGIYVLVMPDRWTGAVAVKVCRDGSPILRDKDGRYWLRRNGLVAYLVENPETVCAS
jgi:uncharacterized protein YjeT (DUF2065 family)